MLNWQRDLWAGSRTLEETPGLWNLPVQVPVFISTGAQVFINPRMEILTSKDESNNLDIHSNLESPEAEEERFLITNATGETSVASKSGLQIRHPSPQNPVCSLKCSDHS